MKKCYIEIENKEQEELLNYYFNLDLKETNFPFILDTQTKEIVLYELDDIDSISIYEYINDFIDKEELFKKLIPKDIFFQGFATVFISTKKEFDKLRLVINEELVVNTRFLGEGYYYINNGILCYSIEPIKLLVTMKDIIKK